MSLTTKHYLSSLEVTFTSVASFTLRLEALKEALANHQDLEVIKSLFQEGKIPDEVRTELWKVRTNRVEE